MFPRLFVRLFVCLDIIIVCLFVCPPLSVCAFVLLTVYADCVFANMNTVFVCLSILTAC